MLCILSAAAGKRKGLPEPSAHTTPTHQHLPSALVSPGPQIQPRATQPALDHTSSAETTCRSQSLPPPIPNSPPPEKCSSTGQARNLGLALTPTQSLAKAHWLHLNFHSESSRSTPPPAPPHPQGLEPPPGSPCIHPCLSINYAHSPQMTLLKSDPITGTPNPLPGGPGDPIPCPTRQAPCGHHFPPSTPLYSQPPGSGSNVPHTEPHPPFTSGPLHLLFCQPGMFPPEEFLPDLPQVISIKKRIPGLLASTVSPSHCVHL